MNMFEELQEVVEEVRTPELMACSEAAPKCHAKHGHE